MRHFIIITFCLLSSFAGYGAGLTLDSCQQMARRNHPLLKQAGVIDEIGKLQLRTINSDYLPKITFNGRATYQSDVTEISLDFSKLGITLPFDPNILLKSVMPEIAKDQYNIYLEIKQKIYDFGMSGRQKELTRTENEISHAQNEVELYRIRESVNALYFGILTLQENRKILELKQQTLAENSRKIASAVKNGMLLPSEQDNLQAEILLTEQQLLEIDFNRRTQLDLLGILTGQDFRTNQNLVIPTTELPLETPQHTRPEFKLFELQKTKIDRTHRLAGNVFRPYLYAFGQGGYGRPALNMLSNKFDFWFMAGVGLQWNLWDGNKTHLTRKTLKLQKKLIDFQQENFERSLRLSTQKEKNNIAKLEEMLVLDGKVADLKGKIAARSSSALSNGTITSADYLRDLNAFLQAQAVQIIHSIELSLAKVNYQTIVGK